MTILALAIRKVRRDAEIISKPGVLQPLSTGILPLDTKKDGPAPDLGPEYQILGLINRGGRGAVYLAEAASGGNQFAVKLPKLPDQDGGAALRSFLREAEESRRLFNANIITVFKAGLEPRPPGRPYYIMEYFHGITLRLYLRQFGVLSEEAALDSVVLRVLDALNYAHRKEPPILHRDLKPENVLVKCDASGAIHDLKVIDFGLSFGHPGILEGTPPYVAPELFGDGKPSPTSDIFSLGVILVELLKGSPPFYDRKIGQMKKKILEESYDRAGISPALLPVLDRMLEKQQDRRYQSADERILDARETLSKRRMVCLASSHSRVGSGSLPIVRRPLAVAASSIHNWREPSWSWKRRGTQGGTLSSPSKRLSS